MKAGKPEKTNFARLLDGLGISYQLRAYEVDPSDLTAISVARKIGLPIEQVFKTLLTRSITGMGARDKDYFFAVIPGDSELDLKKLAQAARVKKVELAALKDADETIELHDLISVSAGQRGLQLLLAPADYLRATGAILADLTKSTSVAPGAEAHA
jgi:Cys-tRNA(Pro)/Cys-tRNA(Cys) deacylase